MGGDREAFGALATRSLPRLVGTAGLILGRHDAAEDAAQEALVRARRDLPSLREPDRFDAWLYRVLIRACHDQRRRESRASDITPYRERPADVAPDHASSFADRDAIDAGLRRLTVDQRTVVVLRTTSSFPTRRSRMSRRSRSARSSHGSTGRSTRFRLLLPQRRAGCRGSDRHESQHRSSELVVLGRTSRGCRAWAGRAGTR